jgi:hypothetical protein
MFDGMAAMKYCKLALAPAAVGNIVWKIRRVRASGLRRPRVCSQLCDR